MSIQKFLCNIMFEGKRFKVFSNNNFKKTFLRVLDDNKLCYPTLEDYAKLDKIYNTYNFDISCTVNRYKFIPGAIHNGKVVVATMLAGAIALFSGCSPKESSENLIEDGVVTQTQQSGDSQQDTSSIQAEQDDTIWVYENGNNIFVRNNDEFRKYVENPNPTFEDLRESLEKNKNINENIRNLLNEYIETLEKENSDTDLVCLYYNMQRLNIRYISEDKIKEEAGNDNTKAFFCASDYTITLPDNFDTLPKEDQEIILYHESNHMINSCEVVVDGKIVRKSFNTYVSNETTDDVSGYIGVAFGEGVDEFFLKDTFHPSDNLPEIGDTISYDDLMGLTELTIAFSSYTFYHDIVDLVCRTTNIDINDMLENDARYVITELEKIGINDAKQIFDLMDTDYNSVAHSHEILLEDNLRAEIYSIYFENLTKQKIKEGWTVDQIYEYTTRVLEDGYIQDLCENYSVSHLFPEQEDLKQKTLQVVQDTLGNYELPIETMATEEQKHSEEIETNSANVKPNIKFVEDFLCVNFEGSEISYEIYDATEDENGNITVYDKDSGEIIYVDTTYGAFVSDLKEEEILRPDGTSEGDYTLDRNQFVIYCRKRLATEDNLYLYKTNVDGEETIKYCYAITEESGEMEFFDATTLEEVEDNIVTGEYIEKLLAEGVVFEENGEYTIIVEELEEYFNNKETSERNAMCTSVGVVIDMETGEKRIEKDGDR